MPYVFFSLIKLLLIKYVFVKFRFLHVILDMINELMVTHILKYINCFIPIPT